MEKACGGAEWTHADTWLSTGVADMQNSWVQPPPVMFFAWINPEFEKMMWVFVCWFLHVRVNEAELQGAIWICCPVLHLVFGSEFDQK